ncbi:MAG: hypothetical protein PHN49_07085, partial [Candidatus Omnitrophica bacterium]|nr:hypothetical protein [Candidatus Omnitrophota bacterium]
MIGDLRSKTRGKVIACVTLASFLVSNSTWGQPAIPSVDLARPSLMISLPDQITIPEELGRIETEFRGTGKNPFVVYIQDAHAIIDAQDHIQNLIGYLQEKYGIGLVALEGGKGKLDPTIFRAFPDAFVKEKVLRRYLEHGEMTGAVMASVMNPKEAVYYGIEDWELYETNYVAYLRAAENKDKLLEKFKTLKTSLDGERQQIYSEKLNEFHEQVNAFRDEQTHLLPFLKYLKRFFPEEVPDAQGRSQAPSTNPDLPRFAPEKYPQLAALFGSMSQEASMDKQSLDVTLKKMAVALKKKYAGSFSRQLNMEFNAKYQQYVTGQVDAGIFLRFMMEAGKTVGIKPKLTPMMRELLGQSETLSMIKGTRLFDELESLTDEIEGRLVASEKEKELAGKYRRIRLLKDLASLELTRDDWGTYENAPDDYLAFLGRDRHLIVPAVEYYQVAIERDAAFHRKLGELFRKEKANAAIVITGGFHAKGFERTLKQAGYSYAVVTPKINSLRGQEAYQEVMEGKISYRKYLETSFYDAFVKASTLQLVGEMNQPDFAKNIKTWRDDVIRRLAGEGRIAEAGKYTRYIDLLFKTYYDKFGEMNKAPKTRNDILSAVADELKLFRENTVTHIRQRFEIQFKALSDGLKQLAGRGAVNADSVQTVLDQAKQATPAAYQSPSSVTCLDVSNDGLGIAGRAMIDSGFRSEMISAADVEFVPPSVGIDTLPPSIPVSVLNVSANAPADAMTMNIVDQLATLPVSPEGNPDEFDKWVAAHGGEPGKVRSELRRRRLGLPSGPPTSPGVSQEALDQLAKTAGQAETLARQALAQAQTVREQLQRLAGPNANIGAENQNQIDANAASGPVADSGSLPSAPNKIKITPAPAGPENRLAAAASDTPLPPPEPQSVATGIPAAHGIPLPVTDERGETNGGVLPAVPSVPDVAVEQTEAVEPLRGVEAASPTATGEMKKEAIANPNAAREQADKNILDRSADQWRKFKERTAGPRGESVSVPPAVRDNQPAVKQRSETRDEEETRKVVEKALSATAIADGMGELARDIAKKIGARRKTGEEIDFIALENIAMEFLQDELEARKFAAAYSPAIQAYIEDLNAQDVSLAEHAGDEGDTSQTAELAEEIAQMNVFLQDLMRRPDLEKERIFLESVLEHWPQGVPVKLGLYDFHELGYADGAYQGNNINTVVGKSLRTWLNSGVSALVLSNLKLDDDNPQVDLFPMVVTIVRSLFGVRAATSGDIEFVVRELLKNAVVHGNENNDNNLVVMRWYVPPGDGHLVLEFLDQKGTVIDFRQIRVVRPEGSRRYTGEGVGHRDYFQYLDVDYRIPVDDGSDRPTGIYDPSQNNGGALILGPDQQPVGKIVRLLIPMTQFHLGPPGPQDLRQQFVDVINQLRDRNLITQQDAESKLKTADSLLTADQSPTNALMYLETLVYRLSHDTGYPASMMFNRSEIRVTETEEIHQPKVGGTAQRGIPTVGVAIDSRAMDSVERNRLIGQISELKKHLQSSDDSAEKSSARIAVRQRAMDY